MDATVEDLEGLIIRRTGKLLIQVGFSSDPDADASPRAYLADPVAYAIRKSGGTTSGFLGAVDADFAAIDDARKDQVGDLAELRAIDNALGNWDEPDQSEGPLSQKLGDLARFFQERAECLRTKVKEVYGVDADVPTIGTDGLGGFSSATGTSSFSYL